MTNRGWLWVLVASPLSGLGCAPVVPAATPALHPAIAPTSELERAAAQLASTNYQEAERLFRQARAGSDAQGASLGLAQLLFETGRYEEAIDESLKVKAHGAGDLIRARALAALGRLDEALEVVAAASGAAAAGETAVPLGLRLERALVRGELLIELGQRQAAEKPLLELVASANAGDFEGLPESERQEAWVLVGRAAHALRAPHDANDAYNKAEAIGPLRARALVWRAQLFLEKYDVGHAEEVLTEALGAAPRRADALVLLARVRLEQSLDFEAAERLARAALAENARSTVARVVLAGNALHDFDLAVSRAELELGLATNPRDLELLSLQAATLLLGEDRSGFDALVDRILELSPGNARVFEVVSEYAQWEHRYEDIEKLLRRGARLDREDGRVRGELGLVLVRSGSDSAGVVELRQAFQLDPFNVRVLNTLDLYEKRIPQGYEEERHGPFTIRYPKAERKLLERYVPALLDAAYSELSQRYGFTPQAPLSIEIYATSSEFAVRTTGLPHAGLAGVCFGRKLATVSPSGQAANLGMTLWHELSHVFHIGLSQSRVPRWLTEGFAEWETASLGRGWSREMDEDLFRALRSERLPQLGLMSRAFTHAESMQDVGTAYHASKRLADWIVASRGPRAAARLLEEFGKKRLPDAVVPEVLGAPFTTLDHEFHAWLRAQLVRYEKQFVSRQVRGSLESLARAAAASGATRTARSDLALALLRDGKIGEAASALEKLVAEQSEPDLAFALGRARMALGDKVNAEQSLRKLIADGHDGYEVRMVLGRLAAGEQKWADVTTECLRASEFDDSGQEAWTLCATAAHQLGDKKAELSAVRGWAELAEHDGSIHRRYLTLLLEAERYEEAGRAADRAVWAGLGVFETHRLASEAFTHAGDKKRAAFERETALLLATTEAEKALLGAKTKPAR